MASSADAFCMTEDLQLVSLDVLARRLRLSKRWLNQEIAEGRLPYLQAGQKRLFNLTAVRNALAQRAAGEIDNFQLLHGSGKPA